MTFLNNQQLVHVAAESFILVIVLFYFSYQHKKLTAGLNICTKRIKEQEIILQNHDKIIKNHDMILRNIIQGKNTQFMHSTKTSTKPPVKPLTTPSVQKSPEKVVMPQKAVPVIKIIEEEIANELDELKVEKDTKKDEHVDKK